jgi:hypothetical protein
MVVYFLGFLSQRLVLIFVYEKGLNLVWLFNLQPNYLGFATLLIGFCESSYKAFYLYIRQSFINKTFYQNCM